MNPDNPTTGEWTVEYIVTRLGLNPSVIADAHNAALAAEREKHNREMVAVAIEYEQQLTAEREKTKQAWREHDDVASALAGFSDTIKQLGARNQQLRSQLAAAVEALKFISEQGEPETSLKSKADAALAKIGGKQ